jgi:hypothetical protein
MEKVRTTDKIADLVVQLGLQDVVEFALQFGGPFHYLAAQAVYLMEPLAGGSRSIARDLGRILEDNDEIEALLDQIRNKREN